MLKARFRKYDNFIFDLDGTIWRWTRLIDGARKTVSAIRKEKKKVYFITNNAALTRSGYARKLSDFGIPASKGDIINPATSAIRLFREKKVYCIGEGIVTDLKRNRVRITDKDPGHVLAAEDRKLTFAKLRKACELIDNGAKGYRTAVGSRWIMGDAAIPGAGAVASFIEGFTGKKMENLGKPSRHMAAVIREIGLEPGRTVVIGDSMRADMPMARSLGYGRALVLTGAASRKDAMNVMVLKSLKGILDSG